MSRTPIKVIKNAVRLNPGKIGVSQDFSTGSVWVHADGEKLFFQTKSKKGLSLEAVKKLYPNGSFARGKKAFSSADKKIKFLRIETSRLRIGERFVDYQQKSVRQQEMLNKIALALAYKGGYKCWSVYKNGYTVKQYIQQPYY